MLSTKHCFYIISNKIFGNKKRPYPIETILKQEGDIACLCTLNLTWVDKSKDAREFASLEIANRSGNNKLEFGHWLKFGRKNCFDWHISENLAFITWTS